MVEPSSADGVLSRPVDVLVVDDHDDVRESTAEILRLEGYTVEEACDGYGALVMMKLREFRAVVLDLRLPGLEHIVALSEMEDPPPVILISAYPIGHQARTMLKNVVAHAQKPVSPSALAELVGRALDA